LQIKVKMADGNEAVYPRGTTCMDLYREKTAENKELLAVLIDGEECDLNAPVPENSEITFVDFDSPQGAKVYRHSASHG